MTLSPDFLQKIFKNHEKIYFVGIKGTGTCALAELFRSNGAEVSGSDTPEIFYTDTILNELHIQFFTSFEAAHVPKDAALVVHSAAYSAESNPELEQAGKLEIPILNYPEALGLYSGLFDSAAISGVHGKTTTTAIAGTLLAATNLNAAVLAGSAVNTFGTATGGARSTIHCGSGSIADAKFFAAETCEYRKHFLHYHPTRIILTAVESDHEDFFPTYNSIRDAFVEFARKLPPAGALIYCADDSGACEVVSILQKEKAPNAIPYGFSAPGPFGIEWHKTSSGLQEFKLAGFSPVFALKVPGTHNVLNTAAALALISNMSGSPSIIEECGAGLREALLKFSGSRRRMEILGEAGGILFADDYGHHPTAIRSTLAGLKAFYPGRRIVCSFMSHTYTRTAALFDEFAACFACADVVMLHKIYASAREMPGAFAGVCGHSLFEAVRKQHPNAHYCEEPLDAADELLGILQSGDIFITMGAGNNWPLGQALYQEIDKR
jgi:UDP-N-acetylmuramate--alanine ligase